MSRPSRPGVSGRPDAFGRPGAPRRTRRMGRRGVRPAWAIAVALIAGLPATATAQDPGRRLAEAPDGTVRLAFAPRPGVWGDGRGVTIGRAGGCACEAGPVRVDLAVRAGRVRGLDVAVGGRPPVAAGTLTDLGRVPAPEAAAFLIGLAREASAEVAEDAIGAAVLADSAELWPELLEIARDADLPRDVRRTAAFWLAHDAGVAAGAELERLAFEDHQDLEVRESAIFALSRLPGERAVPALIRIVRRNPHPDLAREALYWLGQHDDPRALALFEEILVRR